MKAVFDYEPPTFNGTGDTSRDFTFVDNAVEANVLALFTDNKEAVNQVYNIACGEQTSLIELFEYIKQVAGSDLAPKYAAERKGDVKHSLADVSKAAALLNYTGAVKIKEGLKQAFEWYRQQHHFSYST
jgi:UDP-N-acetylglucosamine 4-epimerase